MSVRLTPAQAEFVDAVRAGEDRRFHKSIAYTCEDLGLVRWIAGRAPDGQTFSAADFEPVRGA